MRPVLLLLLLVCNSLLYAASDPVPVGQWRIHLPYNNVDAIAEAGTKIYAAAAYGMFVFNRADGNAERLSPANGLIGYRVQTLKYDESSSTLIIAYNNGRIQFLREKGGDKNDDIFNKTIVGTKTIHHIFVINNLAYLSTSFGLLEMDLAKNEIPNSYSSFDSLGTIEVFSSCIANDSIYISTPKGIFAGSPNDNLNNREKWRLVRVATKGSRHIAAYNGNLYAEVDSQLLVYENKSWRQYIPESQIGITNIDVRHGKLIIGVYGKYIITYNGTDSSHKQVKFINRCLLDQNGNYWYSSPGNGLVEITPNGESPVYPNGPRDISAYQFLNAYDKLWVMPGSFQATTYAQNYNYSRYYNFDNFTWVNAPDNPITNPLYDITVGSFQKQNGRLYLGSHGKGLLRMDNGVPVKVYDETNSPLELRAGFATVVTGLASDAKNNLWISNYEVDSALHMLTPSGVWYSYQLPVSQAGKIVIDSKGNKWILTPRANIGMMVFNDHGTPADPGDDVVVSLNSSKGSGNLPSISVNDIAFTKTGELLVGTDAGFVRIRNPQNVFNGGNFDAERIIISVEQGTNLGGYLLGDEIIYCITLDGADRRWIGTNKGAWLYDSDGETLLKHFTADNSPLMSDNVLHIGIMESTGEVFFGTDQGIASYRGDAMPPTKSIDKLTIFPNPVRPEFDGNIAITGLPDNSLVKITDINGALVYQTFSNGGMATWNCRTFSGERPSTGVYLTFCINPDGSETQVGKILFIH